MKLSKQAETALINASTQSGRIPLDTSGDATVELQLRGLVAKDYGLTLKGRMVRTTVLNAKLEEAF